MKTQKILLLFAMFAMIAMNVNAKANLDKSLNVDTDQKVRNAIQNAVQNEFTTYGNYFYKHEVDRLKDDVTITFFIDNEEKAHLIKIECTEHVSESFIRYLFEDKTISLDEPVNMKKYKMKLKLDYRT